MRRFIRSFIRKVFRDRAIAKLPSRVYLQDVVVPAIAATGRRRMLFVGAQSYNLSFYRCCQDCGIDVWSIDPNPESAPYGGPSGHFVGYIQDITTLAPGKTFDVIIFNGVIGFGVNTPAAAVASLEAMARIAAPGALLVIGWNPGRTDGREIVALRPLLTPISLEGVPAEIEFPALGRAQRDPHRYELYNFKDR